MDIKITNNQPGPVDGTDSVSGTKEGESASGADAVDTQGTERVSSDPVTRIAEDVAAGRISQEDAIEKLVEHTLGSDMVADAPQSIRDEIRAELKTMMQTDPYLQSLAKGLGSEGEGS